MGHRRRPRPPPARPDRPADRARHPGRDRPSRGHSQHRHAHRACIRQRRARRQSRGHPERAQQSITAHAERAAKAETALEREQTALAEAQRNEQRMADTFARLSGEALRASADQLFQRAEQQFRSHQQLAHSDLSALIDPMRQQLAQQEQSIQALEASRQQAYGSIEAQLRQMADGQQSLTAATHSLTTALRHPGVRGRWGELQLRQVVEAAGMSDLCDFSEQQTITTDDGTRQRPDMVIKLPNGRAVIVDAKVPLDAYLAALDEPDEAKRPALLARHAAQVRAHVDAMGSRDYQRSLDSSHDFVVLFIPGEVFYSAALEHDSTLLEHAMAKSVILANPATLIGLLKAVATGWREARLSEEAHTIKTEGENIYKALKTVAEHMGKVGKGLQKSVEAYNSAIGSLEGRLLPSARRMQALKISDEQIATPAPIEQHPRPITRAELLPAPEATPNDEDGQALTA
ncbi:DNA recombination protein RmuC [Chloroflexia bacterium SDU3-3]|nr:DNA recombination protein RmuC [Chloroflexia bacterium SDU3-3]